MAGPYRSPVGEARVRNWCSARLASWELLHEEHEIDTSCGPTHVVSVGTGDGICIYLPGTNFNAASSTVGLSALASRCRVYAADLPGQPGLSSASRPGHELRGYAAWVTDLIAWVRVQLHTLAEFGRTDGPADAIAHGYLSDGPVTLFAADATGEQAPLHCEGVMLSLLGAVDSGTSTAWFCALADEGHVIDDLQERPWGATDGQVIDRYGLHWLIGFEPDAPQ